jgi:hypothetical protein
MARDPVRVQLFYNNFQLNMISRKIESPFLDSFEGTLMAHCSFNYLSTNRDMSLRDLLKFHRGQEVVAWQMERLMLGVGHLHEMGFVHRNLCPEVIFQSQDSASPFFIAGHEYTTQISNENKNFNLPDNKYIFRN